MGTAFVIVVIFMPVLSSFPSAHHTWKLELVGSVIFTDYLEISLFFLLIYSHGINILHMEIPSMIRMKKKKQLGKNKLTKNKAQIINLLG